MGTSHITTTAPGLWTDINNIYTLYENNIIEDNVRGGIFHEISYDATIRNNTIRRNGTGKDYPVVDDRRRHRSRLVPQRRGLRQHAGGQLAGHHRAGTTIGAPGTHGAWVMTNMNVHDNTVTSLINEGGGGRSGLVDTVGTDAFLPAANNRFQRNSYTLGTNAWYFMWMGQDLNESEWRAYRTGHDRKLPAIDTPDASVISASPACPPATARARCTSTVGRRVRSTSHQTPRTCA